MFCILEQESFSPVKSLLFKKPHHFFYVPLGRKYVECLRMYRKFSAVFCIFESFFGKKQTRKPETHSWIKSFELEAMQVRIVTLSNRDKDRVDQIIMQGGQLEPGPVCMPRSYHCNLQHFCQQLQTQIQIQNSKSTKYK